MSEVAAFLGATWTHRMPRLTCRRAGAEVRGALAVAGAFAGRAVGTQTAIIDGFVGAIWAQGGRPLAVLEFRIAHGKIVSMDMVGDPKRLGELELQVLSWGLSRKPHFVIRALGNVCQKKFGRLRLGPKTGLSAELLDPVSAAEDDRPR